MYVKMEELVPNGNNIDCKFLYSGHLTKSLWFSVITGKGTSESPYSLWTKQIL